MSFIAVASGVFSIGMGVFKAVEGKKAAEAAKKEAALAKGELDKQKKAFSALDTSNPYANMENTMEDLTVNTQAAEFQKQQSMQSQANVMDSMRGAAGGSGIAALAQSMANQGSIDAQKASASIGQQEAQNQKMSAQEASKNQGLERQGEMQSRNMQFGKISSLMGMAGNEVAGANARQQAGQQMSFQGLQDAATGLTDFGENKGWFEGEVTQN